MVQLGRCHVNRRTEVHVGRHVGEGPPGELTIIFIFLQKIENKQYLMLMFATSTLSHLLLIIITKNYGFCLSH